MTPGDKWLWWDPGIGYIIITSVEGESARLTISLGLTPVAKRPKAKNKSDMTSGSLYSLFSKYNTIHQHRMKG